MGRDATARLQDRRDVASVALLCELAADRGLDRNRCLQGTGIDPSTLSEPDTEIVAHQELRVIGNIVESLDDPAGAGLDAGLRYRLTAYGIWSFALLASKSVRDAHAVAMEFVDLTYAFTCVSAVETPGGLLVSYDDLEPALSESVRRFVLERDLAAAMVIWRDGLAQQITPLRLTLRLPMPADAGRFEQVFGVTPEFEAARTVMTMDGRLLDLPLPQASELTAKVCAAQCAELLDRKQARRGVSGRVRDELIASVPRIPTQDEIARSLHVSIRTLRRQLADEGTSFRALVEHTRQGLAEELLRTGRLTIEQVADRVGYSEASSFVHAFIRWNGVAPRRWARERSMTAARPGSLG
jgi:AraC-like DNA-binding protein